MPQLDPSLATILMTALLFVLLALGVHIGVALGMVGFLGLLVTLGAKAALAQLSTIPFNVTAVYALGTLPMFILMGSFFSRGGFATELYRAAYYWLGSLRGGLAMATTVGSAIFGAISGSSVANAAVFARIALPEMVQLGYDKRLAAGSIAAVATLDALIPPSILAVIYGIITETPVGKVLIAGFIPGFVGALIYMLGIYIWVRLNPRLAPVISTSVSWRQRLVSLGPLWSAVFVFTLAMGGIYVGIFTPTQAGAVGAFCALLATFIGRRLSRSVLWDVLKEAGTTTANVLLILLGGFLFARFLAFTGIIADVSDFLLSLNAPPIVYLLVYMVIMVILGMFLEGFSMMILTLPVMFPILNGVGYDPVWLGIITIQVIGIGLITPPVGLNVYVVKGASSIPLTLEDIFIGVGPFVIMAFITLALFIAFPQIVLVLPNLMTF